MASGSSVPKSRGTPFTSYLYDTQIEIFMAIRDLELRYGSNSRNAGSKISPSLFELTVIGFWKPPGALQWVEKCVTETVYKEKNPRYATNMYVNCDQHDADGIELKFQLLEGNYFGPQKTVFMHTLGVVQTKLSRLLAVGSVGLLIPIEIPDPKESSVLASTRHQVTSAQCFLRAEILKPIDDAVIFQFGILPRISQARLFFSRKFGSYYLEVLKINEGVNFEINQPYTLIYRSEPLNSSVNHCWTHIILPIIRVCNGDMDRVLKLVIYDSSQTFLVDGERIKTGFVLTTLRKLMELVEKNPDSRSRKLNIVKFKDGKDSQKICLLVNQCSAVGFAPLETFLNNGLTLRRIYAVDFSKSNWNSALHKCHLHESPDSNSGDAGGGGDGAAALLSSSPYEQAIEIIGKLIQPISSGQSVFYSFGNPSMRPFVETIEEKHHMRSLFNLYSEALGEAKQAQEMYADEFSTEQCFQKLSLTPRPGKRSTRLVNLLNDLLALLNLRTGGTHLEYFVAFIFTDGEFADLEESMKLIIELAQHPISLIFISIGLGNLEFLLSLQEGWVHPTTNEYPKRNIITVIHFRSLQNWYSAIKYGSSFKSDPMMLLQKEIYNSIDKQAVQFLRTT